MKRPFAYFVLVLLIASEVVWFIRPRQGSLMGEAYRNRERIEALKQSVDDPSPRTRDAANKELELVSRHVFNRNLAVFGALLLLDGVLIFYLWKSGAIRSTTNPRPG